METIYERGASTEPRITAEWDSGSSWIAHPNEGGQRGSHALRTAEGVWIINPIDAPTVDDRIRSSPAVADGTVFVRSSDGDVYAISEE